MLFLRRLVYAFFSLAALVETTMRMSTEKMLSLIGQRQDDDTLGGRIWRARTALNLSTADLARQLGVRPDTISAWERDRSEPRTSRLFVLAGLLKVTPAWLMEGRGEAPRDGLSLGPAEALAGELSKIRALHAETGRAIAALELALSRVLQDI